MQICLQSDPPRWDGKQSKSLKSSHESSDKKMGKLSMEEPTSQRARQVPRCRRVWQQMRAMRAMRMTEGVDSLTSATNANWHGLALAGALTFWLGLLGSRGSTTRAPLMSGLLPSQKVEQMVA